MRRIRAALSLTPLALVALGCSARAAPAPAVPRPVSTALAPVLELVVDPSSIEVGEPGPHTVVLRLENRGPEPVRLPPSHARVQVRSRGAPLRTCSAPRWAPLSGGGDLLAPGATLALELTLPCVLTDGAHTIEVELALGPSPDDGSPLAQYLAASAPLEVDGALAQHDQP